MHRPKPIPLQAAEMIHAERYRQQTQEGYSIEHDDEHTEGQLAVLAAGYVLSSRGKNYTWLVGQVASVIKAGGWSFKPADPIRDLVFAGALILAELERRLRAEEEGKMSKSPTELPRWQSHKVVEADKIVGDQTDLEGYPANGSCWLLSCGVVIPNPPQSRVPEGVSPIGGYFVRYEDGFESWSPSEAFGNGYSLIP